MFTLLCRDLSLKVTLINFILNSLNLLKLSIYTKIKNPHLNIEHENLFSKSETYKTGVLS